MSAQGNGGMTVGIESTPKYARQQMLATPEQRQRIRANASLPQQAWIDVENAVYPAMDDVLTVFSDIRNAGLTVDADIMNKSVEWNKQDYEATAIVSMDPEHRPDSENHVEYDVDGAPLPLIHSDFSVGFRESGGTNTGQSVETLNAAGAARVVGEAAEHLLLNGWDATIGGETTGGSVDGYTMYGLTNHPSAHTGTISDWSTTPGDVRPQIQQMARDLKDDEFRPGNTGYFTYISSDLEDTLYQPDPEGSGDLNLLDRVTDLTDIGTFRVADHLPEGSVLMFRPTRDVIDLAIGLEEQVVQWEDPFRDYFKTIMGYAPRVKDTMRGQSGIAFYTTA